MADPIVMSEQLAQYLEGKGEGPNPSLQCPQNKPSRLQGPQMAAFNCVGSLGTDEYTLLVVFDA